MRKVVLLIYFIIFSYSAWANTESDTVLVTDLMEETYFFESSSYLPLVNGSEFEGKTLHFKLEQHLHASLLLKVSATQDLALFVNNNLIQYTEAGKTRYLSTDELFNKYGTSLHFTIYNKILSAKNLQLQLLTVSDAKGEEFLDQKEVVVLSQRQRQSVFNNYLIVGFIIIAAFLATLNNYYPRVTAEFFKFTRALAVREIDENLLKSRPFTWINILFYIFFSVLTGYLLVSVFYLAPFKVRTDFKSTWSTVWFWLQVSGLIFVWLIVKYSILRNFTSLFNIKSFLSSHYFNYVRIGLLVFMLMVGAVILSYIGFDITSPDYYSALFTALLIGICIRSVFLMFKLMNSASYKFLHLFSYLCATELIPLGIILFLGFNQPF